MKKWDDFGNGLVSYVIIHKIQLINEDAKLLTKGPMLGQG